MPLRTVLRKPIIYATRWPVSPSNPDRVPLDRGRRGVASCFAVARQVRKRGGLVREIEIAVLVASAMLALWGCESSLGACDMAAATVVVYRAGVPYYEGQALVESRCAGGFCHSANAKGANRFGAPAELNFDVTVVTPAQTLADVQHHREGLASIAEWDADISDLVADGTMPPGKAGKRDPGVWLYAAADGSLPTGMDATNQLFDIGTARGHETLRNWLACGHPTVAGTDDLQSGLAAAVAGLGGAVLPSKSSATCVLTAVGALGPVLDAGNCASCHVAGGAFAGQTNLDLSRPNGDIMPAHGALLNRDAWIDGPCSGHGRLILPNQCFDSLLYQKLVDGPLSCGAPMPQGGARLSADLLMCLCQWINAGAPLN